VAVLALRLKQLADPPVSVYVTLLPFVKSLAQLMAVRPFTLV
jgi:hypothetical protein